MTARQCGHRLDQFAVRSIVGSIIVVVVVVVAAGRGAVSVVVTFLLPILSAAAAVAALVNGYRRIASLFTASHLRWLVHDLDLDFLLTTYTRFSTTNFQK